jgi:FAD-dependent sensor of blue light
MSLQQLIYSSTATKEFSEAHLSFLLLNARQNNQSLGVTGILLYDAGSFLQVLEGEGATIEALYRRISRDPRHAHVSKLLTREINAREFGEWSMGFVATKAIATSLPGYSDYLQHRGDPAGAGALAARLVSQFRDGQYRQHVER